MSEHGSVSKISMSRCSAYAVWTGIGAVGTAILGIALLGDSMAPPRILCIGVIVAGIVGLKLVSAN
nr:SMR family transporter [Pseudomonas sp. PB101]